MGKADPDIINRLKREILPLQGFRPSTLEGPRIPGFASVESAFPDHRFPTGAIHEFICQDGSTAAATSGFICGILVHLMNKTQPAVWITSSRQLYPPAIAHFGIAPERIIIIETQHEKELLWIMEEALKCEGLAAVVCEISGVSFIASRRLQLAVEDSGVTGMLIRNTKKDNVTSSIARWRISSLPGSAPDNLPGLGFPRWKVTLEKVRNGKPASWQIEYNGYQFKEIINADITGISRLVRKTG
jgi:protein ImuA